MNEITNYEQVLNTDGVLVQNTVGVSMLPLLRQRKDNVIIKALNGAKPKKNDVVFYKRDNGQYVLHRVIKVKKDGYVIRGDNCYSNEYDITDRHILGILCEIYRNGKHIDCKSSLGYRTYVFFWRYTYFIRKAYKLIRHAFGKIKRKAHDLFS